MEILGLSQSELARRVGVTQPTIAKLVSGMMQGSTHLARIARELQTTPAYLQGDTDDPNEGAIPPPTAANIAEHLDLVELIDIDADYGMGLTVIGDHIEQRVSHFPRWFVEMWTSSPATALAIARGKGDSMEPTIRDRDLVMFDRSQRVLDEQDAIWILTVGDIGMIKRLRRRGRQIVIQSDKDGVSDEVVDFEEINLIGRVVFIGRRM
ncbi:MAG TPA: S24 family peptidase [Sphingomonas sp.]|nr:S24 family peptidase [Sphingomonas sp.]